MLRTTVAAAAAACLTLGLAACSTSYINPDGASQRLRSLDVKADGTAHAPYTYTKAFAKLNGECKEQNAALAAVIQAGVGRLQQAKAPGRTALSLMKGMAAVIPAGSKGTVCSTVAGAYVASHEVHK